MKSKRGFTLIELIVFVAIFSVAMGAFLAVFTNISEVAVRQSSTAEVQSQSQFLLQTVQYYVERSSAVSTTVDEATDRLVLRMPSSTEDPAIIELSDGAVSLKLGSGPEEVITSDKVAVSDLAFVKRSNPGGKDSVAVSFTVTYATSNPSLGFSQSLRSGIARVSAATFDSDVVPNEAGEYALGTVSDHWTSINNTIFFNGSNVGIGTASPGAPLEVDGDIYISDSGSGLILNDGSSCWRVTISGAGALSAASTSCP